MNLLDTSLPAHTITPALSDASYRLYSALATLIDRMHTPDISGTGIIPWGARFLHLAIFPIRDSLPSA